MKLAFLFNYPLVDNVNWKKEVMQKLIFHGHQVDVYYGKTNLSEYIKAYLIARRHGSRKTIPTNHAIKAKSNLSFFKANGIPIFKIKNFNKPSSINKIKTSNYNYVFTAIDQILTKKFINGINTKIINIHYARLPDIKGMNAIEWNFMINGKCEFSLHFINEGIDTGEIIKIVDVPFVKGDSFYTMRERLQKKIPDTIIGFTSQDRFSTVPNSGGKLYTYMHPEIKNILIKAE